MIARALAHQSWAVGPLSSVFNYIFSLRVCKKILFNGCFKSRSLLYGTARDIIIFLHGQYYVQKLAVVCVCVFVCVFFQPGGIICLLC